MTGWFVRLSIRSAMFAGAIAGFVFGLFAGGALGALFSWFAGAIIDWQAQLGFSLGVAQQLLPLGDQLSSLQTFSDRWYIVIPVVGLAVGVLGALFGILAAGLWAALVNMGLLPIEVFIYRAEEPDVAVDAAVDAAKPRAKRARRRKAIGE
jgi:cobalamin synthase